MRRIFNLFLLFASFSAFSQEHTLTASFAEAQATHKKVMLFFSGSDWCSPCAKFKKNFLDTSAFATFAKEKLVIFNADFPRQKKNALTAAQTVENEKLAEKYNPDGLFPYIILFDENGKILRKWEGLPQESLTGFIEKLN